MLTTGCHGTVPCHPETASLAFTKTYTKPSYTTVRVQTKVLHCNLFLLQHITTAIAVGWLVNLLTIDS